MGLFSQCLGLRRDRNCGIFIVLTFIIVILMLWRSVDFDRIPIDAKHERFESTHGFLPTQYQEQLVQSARSAAGCIKPIGAKEHIVCGRLPFTAIKCGSCFPHCSAADGSGKPLRVPNIIHFIWFGDVLNITSFIHYLALRSVASVQRPHAILIHYNAKIVVHSRLLRRIQDEIPCIQLRKYDAPLRIFGTDVRESKSIYPDSSVTFIIMYQIKEDLFRSDIARLQILLEYGGIYLDLDVITLKRLDEFRRYPATVGRSRTDKVSNGIIFSEPDSEFLRIWLQSYKSYDSDGRRSLAFWGLNVPYSLYMQYKDKSIAHMDEVLMNRPNPYEDGLDATTIGHYDITENYFLHVHPRAIENTEYDLGITNWTEERLRVLDSTYGQAARVALFGSSDLIYNSGEFFREPFAKRVVLRLYQNNQ